MSFRTTFVMLALLMCYGVSHAEDKRWNNFAEDSDVKYFIDKKSMVSRPDNVYLFWVKAVAKDKDYFKREYNLNDVAYTFTSYELDCAVSNYRVRGVMMYDKDRREISKSLPAGDPSFEPVTPESVLELAQDEICVTENDSVPPTVKNRRSAATAVTAATETPSAPSQTLTSPDALTPPDGISPSEAPAAPPEVAPAPAEVSHVPSEVSPVPSEISPVPFEISPVPSEVSPVPSEAPPTALATPPAPPEGTKVPSREW